MKKSRLHWFPIGTTLAAIAIYISWLIHPPAPPPQEVDSSKQASLSLERYIKQCDPQKFDGRCLYHAAWQAFWESDLALANNPELRQSFLKWEHKFDETGDLDCPNATAENRFSCPAADRAIRMMRDVLQGPFDYYFDPDETALSEQRSRSALEGIGAPVELRDAEALLRGLGAVTEIEARKAMIIGTGHELVVAQDPAPEAGAAGILRKGDVILAVKEADASGDATTLDGMNIDEAVRLIRGTDGNKTVAGTKVELLIERQNEQGQPVRETKLVPRKKMVMHAVTSVKQRDTTVIKIKSFDMDNMGEDAVKALSQAEQNSKGIVLDLRSNPGGKLPFALGVLSSLELHGPLLTRIDRVFDADALLVRETFLQPGFTIVVERRSDTEQAHVSVQGRTPLLVNPQKPVRVLLDGGSASASEVVAGGLQASGRAKIMAARFSGSHSVARSVGKDQGQISVPLPYNRMARVPLFVYLPGGLKMPGGLVPDIEVPISEDDIKSGRDPLLEAALASIETELAEKQDFAERSKAAALDSQRFWQTELCARSKIDAMPPGQRATEDVLKSCAGNTEPAPAK